jgi:cytochrome c-type biogenesis protein
MERLRPIAAALLILIAVAGLGAWAWRSVAPPPAAPAAPVEAGRRPVVYYLHGALRCVTCNAVEQATRQAVAAFTPAPGATRPELRTENFQKSGNEHFARDFQVSSSSVLLAEVEAGRIVRGQLCPLIWELCKEHEALVEYLDAEMRLFYSAVSTPATATPATSAPPAPARLGWWLGLASALGLGFLTAISPCPLATNIAAISFLARKAGDPRRALLAGLAYTLGRALVYVVLGAVLAGGLLSIPAVANFLAVHVNAVLGPLLILVAVFLLRLVEMTWSLGGDGSTMQRWGERGGIVAAFGLGVLFALAFCPTSAALFFGALVPLAVNEGEALLLPAAYGLTTALPVLVFAIVVVVAAQAAGRIFQRLSSIETGMRWATGAVFLAVGLYYTIRINLFPAT